MIQAANETTSNANTAEGFQALQSITTGSNNTALGAAALFSLTTGVQNTATGAQALKNNTASSNTADGFQALVNNSTGPFNTATGWRALFKNSTGDRNTADGSQALNLNTTGEGNTAIGRAALNSNTNGSRNTATGWAALQSNTGSGSGSPLSGDDNSAYGVSALINNTTGHDNTAVGDSALNNNKTGFLNTALGSLAGSVITGNNNIDIGNEGVAAENNTIRIGTQVDTTDIFGFILPKHTATYIAGISGVTIMTNAAPVAIDTATGQLGLQAVSSQRFKDDIKPMDKTSEAILALKPVTFHYKKDPTRTAQFGLVAEDVSKVNPSLVTRDDKGEIYTVRYDAVNAMLLNEFLKAHRQIEEQQKEIEALRTLIQKVSDKVEMNKPAPQMVLNSQ